MGDQHGVIAATRFSPSSSRFTLLASVMDRSSLFFANSLEDMETRDGTGDSPGDEDTLVTLENQNGSAAMECRTTTSPANAKGTLTQSFHKTSPNDVAAYDNTSDDNTAPAIDLGEAPGHKGCGPLATTAPNTEFDAIAREAAVLLDKKLDNNRAWVKKLLSEMTLYAKTLSEVHSEYSRIQDLEHKESQRLDQVEPEVQGATSHLLENPYIRGIENRFRRGNESAAFGTKRKSDQS